MLGYDSYTGRKIYGLEIIETFHSWIKSINSMQEE